MSLTVIKAGLLDTVQDSGRYGHQHLGINPGGAMDRFSAALANALLGKDLRAPVIELHFPAAQIQFQQPAIIVLTGADFLPCLNGEEISLNQPVAVGSHSVLSFRQKRVGARCYLSLFNELEIPTWLNSYSTNLKAGAGGYAGRPLQKGDALLFSTIPFSLANAYEVLPWKYKAGENDTAAVALLPGPEWDWLTPESQEQLLNSAFTITPASDRMGYHLQGPALVPQRSEQLLSSGVTFGTVQLLPNGQLIVLMADHQTTGGYPRIATVMAAHLPGLAQRGAGETVRFILTGTAEAEATWVASQKTLFSLQNTCKLKRQTWMHAHRHQL